MVGGLVGCLDGGWVGRKSDVEWIGKMFELWVIW